MLCIISGLSVERKSINVFVLQMCKEILDAMMGFASLLIRRQVRRILVFAELDSSVETCSFDAPVSSVELFPSAFMELVSSSESSKPIYTVVEANNCWKIIWRISVGTVMSVLGMFFETFEVVHAGIFSCLMFNT